MNKPGVIFNIVNSLLALFCLSIFTANAQPDAAQKAFYRLNIANEKNELMVVKIKGRDLWVTPGLYSPEKEFNLAKLTDLAATYGLMISEPDLKGEFLIKPAPEKPYSTRYLVVR